MIYFINAFASLFLFLGILIFHVSAESIHLNQIIYNETINMKGRLPIFIELWDPHCHNCQAFKRIWERLASLEYFQKKILFADINCIIENKLCQKISPGKEYPRFAWIDVNESVPRSYTGSYALLDLAAWLKTRFQSSLDVINDSIQFEKIKQISIKTSLFRFTISELDKKSYQILTAAVNSVKHLDVKMILNYSNQQTHPILEHFTRDDRIIQMKNAFTFNSITYFIKAHSVLFFTSYNDFIGQFSSAEKVPIMVFVYSHNNSQLRKVAINLAKSMEELSIIPISQLCCQYNSKFCRYYGIKDVSKWITVIILDKYKNIYWSFEYNKDDIKLLKAWTLAVLKHKIRPYGPGSTINVLRPLLEMFYELRSQGGWRYYFFFTPFVVLMVFIITLAMYLAESKLEESANIKKGKTD